MRGEFADALEPEVIPRRLERGSAPLSFAQQRLWFLDQLVPGSPFYNIPTAVRLTGQLDVTTLERSLDEIIRRHEALRTTFEAVAGRPVQVVAPTLTVPLPALDLRALSEAEREAGVRRLATAEAQQPFDLELGPLVRVTLLQLGDEEHVLLVTMHHIVSDGWSMSVFIRELVVLYQAFLSGAPSPLPELPIQYADFAVWQLQWLQGEVLEKQLSYWKKQLGDNPPRLELPTDRPRPPIETYRGAHRTFTLPETLGEALEALSRQEGTTLFVTLLAAFNVLLHRYTEQEDILVGSPIANRNRVEIEELIGFFVNTLVLHTDLAGNPAFRELLGRVQEVTLGAHTHQDLPFERLVEEIQTERDLSRNPLFQVMFVLQNVPTPYPRRSGLTFNLLEVDSGTARLDLALTVEQAAQGLWGEVEYNTDLFDDGTIERLVKHFQTLLEGIVATPQARLSDLPLLTEAERQQMLVVWNDTGADYPQDRCLHELFEAQVARTPEAVALVFADEELTYGELDSRANQLAHHLQGLGVGPEVLVGICVERSPEMVVGLLGILKAGGAYVPLDPTYPEDRLAFMLEDTQTPASLLTS